MNALNQEPGSIVFTVPGRLGGKGRPRFSAIARRVRVFTPAKTKYYEALVRHFAQHTMTRRGFRMLVGPLHMHVQASLHHPKRFSQKARKAAVWVTGRPDCDNVLKLIGDALNGLAYKDDAQIASLCFQRRYDSASPEGVTISVKELKPNV